MGWQRRPTKSIKRTKIRKKDFFGALLVLIVVGIVTVVAVPKINKPPIAVIAPTANTSTIKTLSDTSTKPKITRLLATGDSIAHDAINGAAKQADGTYAYASMMTAMKPILANADIRFCNQSTQVGGLSLGVTGYPDFNAPFSFASDLVNTGCNLITTASNHSSDKGKAAIDANVSFWAQQNGLLAVTGQYNSAEDHETVRYFEKDGLKYAFLSYSTYTNHPPPTDFSVGMYSRDYASRQIVAAKAAGAKFIIVSMRWGTEYSQTVNAYQLAESQFLADQGVQLILGHGAHVLEPVKKLNGASGNETLVWFGLGNFIHAQLEPETIFNGIAVVDIDPITAKVIHTGFLPTYMHYDWTADQAAKQDLLARHNFALVPLQNAASLFTKSQLKTTIEAQKTRLQTTLTTYMSVPFMTVQDFGL